MNFKKLLMSCLSAAMVVSSLTGGAYATDEVPEVEQTTSRVVTAPGYQEVDSEILKDHARAKNEKANTGVKGGPVEWAFDDEDHWWHSIDTEEGAVRPNNHIWIETGFGGEKKIKKVTYQPRTNNPGGIINEYDLQVANTTGTPTDNDFDTVASGNFDNVRTEQTIVLSEAQTATHIRLVAKSVFNANDSERPYASAKRIRVFEEVERKYDLNNEADFWDYETYKGTLGQQSDDEVWTYQIRTNGTWSNLPESAFHGDVWMCQNSEDPTYFWAKLGRSNITSTFNTQQALAFTWKAEQSGYYKAGIKEPIEGNNDNKLKARVWHTPANLDTEDGKVIFEDTLSVGAQFTTDIVKVEAGDLIRIGAVKDNAWAQNFLPYVEEVGVKDYATQYLTKIEGIENNGNYSDLMKVKVQNARNALTEAITAQESDSIVQDKLTALEQIIASLGSYTPVESITLNKTELSLNIGASEKLTVTVDPEGALKDVEWITSDENVATVVDGTVTAVAAGTATITVKSLDNPQLTDVCDVTVGRDDSALDTAIQKAENKQNEENYSNYTEASRNALKDALEAAKNAKENQELTAEDVNVIVEALENAINGLVLKYVVTITINGDIETRYCEKGENVRLNAPEVDGQQFSHWTYNGTPICYDPDFMFSVTGSAKLEAVYVTSGTPIQQEATVICTAIYEDGKVKFNSKHSVPADQGYTVIRTGVVTTDQTGFNAIEAAGEELSLKTQSTSRVAVYSVNTSSYLVNYSKAIKTTRKTTWYVKGFVEYKDASGELYTVYSDLTSCVVQ